MPTELTLILAATREMGIGRNGTLPWTGLKKEMAYFARVTKRLPPRCPASARNAVVMGRKTWDSIPERFRPLPGRLNVVISRSVLGGGGGGGEGGAAAGGDKVQVKEKGDVWAGSLEKAVEWLTEEEKEGKVGRVFIIGGGMVYSEALRMGAGGGGGGGSKIKVLLTRVEGDDWGCDTFFEEKLEEGVNGWHRKSKGEMDEFVGEVVPEGRQEEGGTGYEFEMWERV